MGKTFEELTAASVETQEQAVELIEKLYDVAQPGAVFSEPRSLEGRTVITAAEVYVGLGVGFGFGGGSGMLGEDEEKPEALSGQGKGAGANRRVTLEGGGEAGGSAEEGDDQRPGEATGAGGGGGGGGGASGRPVAVISVSEDGIEVEPIVDVTKIALAFFTALGSMSFMLMKMRKAADQ